MAAVLHPVVNRPVSTDARRVRAVLFAAPGRLEDGEAMADVFVAFVREDQAFAESIAIALQDAGLTVSRSGSVMEAIDASPAVVVLWTMASSRSRLFLDAADRAFRSGKMVLARLGGAPPPMEFGQALQHEFRTWSGDPDHTELAVIVAHVQRLNQFAQARMAPGGGYGAPQGGAQPYPGQQARGAPQPGGPAGPQGFAGGDPHLAEEAAFWRRANASGTPADYRAYLDRYGPNGAFAELAGLRLAQMNPAAPPPQRPQPPAPLPPAPMPQARMPQSQPPGGAGSFRFDPPSREDLRGRDSSTSGAPPARPPYEPEPFRQDRRPPPPDMQRLPNFRRDHDTPVPPPPKSGAGIGAILFLIILGGLGAGAWFVYNGGSFLPPPPRDGATARVPIVERRSVDAPTAEPDAGLRPGDTPAKPGSSPNPPQPAEKTPAPKAAPPGAAPPTKAGSAKASPAAPATNTTDLEQLRREIEAEQAPKR